MLQRILEPEVMDTVEDARDYDAMDHGVVNKRFADDFLLHWSGGNPVLDVGTGTAQIPIELCRQSRTITITAIDLAVHMLEYARSNVRHAGFAERITIELIDAKTLPYSDRSFAAVISNSILHHIPDPMTCLREMNRVCQPGGLLFVRDLIRPDTMNELEHLVSAYARDGNPHQKKLFADSLHASLTVEEVRGLVSRLGYPPSCIEQTSDRHWTFVAHRPE